MEAYVLTLSPSTHDNDLPMPIIKEAIQQADKRISV
jgi:hypothetical protein